MAADAIQGFGSIVFAQIRYLVVNLNKKNQKSSTSEIAHLLGMYGEGAFIYLIQCLVEEIDFRDAKLQKDQLKVQLLATEFGKLAGILTSAGRRPVNKWIQLRRHDSPPSSLAFIDSPQKTGTNGNEIGFSLK